jgi:hypothetical protein
MNHPDQLKDYVSRKYQLTPLHPRSKAPIHNEWQLRPMDLTDFIIPRNVGIVLGWGRHQQLIAGDPRASGLDPSKREG